MSKVVLLQLYETKIIPIGNNVTKGKLTGLISSGLVVMSDLPYSTLRDRVMIETIYLDSEIAD